MAEEKKISELTEASDASSTDEFVVVNKDVVEGQDASASGQTSKITLSNLRNAILSGGSTGGGIQLGGSSPEIIFNDSSANDRGSLLFQDGSFQFWSNYTGEDRPAGNATNHFIITKSGNVGIGAGSLNPASRLDVSGQTYIHDNVDERAPLYVVQDGTGPSAYFMGGGIGIGTNSPEGDLHVYSETGVGQVTIEGSQPRFYLKENDETDLNSLVRNLNGKFQIDTVNDEGSAIATRFQINHGNGNVGINTDSPTARLTVVGEPISSDEDLSPEKVLSLVKPPVSGITYAQRANFFVRKYEGNETAGVNTHSRTQLDIALSHSKGENGEVSNIDGTNERDGGTQIMTLRSDGNVGIGTTAPANNLVIRGSSDTDSYTSDDPPFMVIENSFNEYSKNNIFGGIGFSKSGSLNVNGSLSSGIRAGLVAVYDEDYNFSATQNDNNVGMGLNFRTSAQNAVDSQTSMSITGNGNVGIGTQNPTAKLEVNGAIKASGGVSSSAFDSSELDNVRESEANAIEKLNEIVVSDFEKDGVTKTGIVAQDMQKVLPNSVSGGEEYDVVVKEARGMIVSNHGTEDEYVHQEETTIEAYEAEHGEVPEGAMYVGTNPTLTETRISSLATSNDELVAMLVKAVQELSAKVDELSK